MKDFFDMTKKQYYAAIGSMAVYIGLFCFLGYFNHPQSDDYWGYIVNRGNNTLEVVSYYYNSWMGNYTWLFCGSIIGLFDNLFLFVRWYPTFLVTCSLAAFLFFFVTYRDRLSFLTCVFLSLLSQCVWFTVISTMNETLFWFAASVGYYNTCTVIVLQLAFLARLFYEGYLNKSLAFYGLILTTLLAGGMATITVAAQVPFFLTLSILCMLYGKRENAVRLFVVTLTALVGLWVVYYSPGTAIRTINDGVRLGLATHSIKSALFVSLTSGGLTFRRFFMKPLIYVIILFIPLWEEKIRSLNILQQFPFKIRILHILLLEFIIASGFMFIPGWALGGCWVTGRLTDTVFWIMSITWIFFFAFCYRNRTLSAKIEQLRIYKWRCYLLAFCLVFNFNFFYLIHDYRIGPTYSDQMNAQYNYIKLEKAKHNFNPVVPAPTVYPFLIRFHLGIFDPWNSSLFAEYWGVNSVTQVPFYILDITRKNKYYKDCSCSIREWAERGSPLMQLELAKQYDRRINTDHPDDAEAAKWYLKAAEKGNKSAQRLLVEFYRHGWGVKQNYFLAAKWFLLSYVRPPLVELPIARKYIDIIDLPIK